MLNLRLHPLSDGRFTVVWLDSDRRRRRKVFKTYAQARLFHYSLLGHSPKPLLATAPAALPAQVTHSAAHSRSIHPLHQLRIGLRTDLSHRELAALLRNLRVDVAEGS
jgi:hypothetical protein